MSKFKVGDTVRANKLSNERYTCTRESLGFEGEVIEVQSDGIIRVKTTKSEVASEIGWKYRVLPKYFDLIESAPQKIRKKDLLARIEALESKIEALQ